MKKGLDFATYRALGAFIARGYTCHLNVGPSNFMPTQ